MKKPTKGQIEKFLHYLKEMEHFWWLHFGDEKADPDLVEVVSWLKEIDYDQ